MEIQRILNWLMPLRAGAPIAWDHGANRKFPCFGDAPIIKIDPEGPYSITAARSPQLQRYVGRRISFSPRDVTQVLTDLLLFTDELLTKRDIPHWINSGTLLGTVRQGGVLPWDNDGDMLFRLEDADRIFSLKSEVEAAGHLFTTNKHGPTHKIYVKSARLPKIMVELCCMHPRDVTLPDGQHDTLWTYHPIMLEAVASRVARISSSDPTNEIAAHRARQRSECDIFIDNQYLTSEIFPLSRIPFSGTTISAPAKASTILQRDYGASGLRRGLVSCACQWTDGDYLLTVDLVGGAGKAIGADQG